METNFSRKDVAIPGNAAAPSVKCFDFYSDVKNLKSGKRRVSFFSIRNRFFDRPDFKIFGGNKNVKMFFVLFLTFPIRWPAR